MVFTELQALAIARMVGRLAMINPKARGNLISVALSIAIPGCNVEGRPPIAKMLPDNRCGGCRAWLHNIENRTKRGHSWMAAAKHANEFLPAVLGPAKKI